MDGSAMAFLGGYLIKYGFGNFMLGFIPFAFLRYIFFVLKLDNEQAVGRQFETRQEYYAS